MKENVSEKILNTKLGTYYCPTNIYLFKFNYENSWKRCKICSKSTTKTLEWFCFGAFIVNFQLIPHLSIVSIVEFKQVNISCVEFLGNTPTYMELKSSF